jgi:hypothetical protein
MAKIAWVMLFSLTALAQAPASLMGRWRSIGTSSGGLGAMFEFRDDGTFSFSIGAVVEMKYRIESNQLIFPPGTINGPEQHQTMEWVSADRLVLNGAEIFSRQGTARDTNNPILGEWTTPRETGGVKSEARWFFEPEGKSLLLFPFKWQKGAYSVKAVTIRLEYPKETPVEGPFRIEGDVLTIPRTGGTGESRLRRY